VTGGRAMGDFLRCRRICVTGGGGFLGRVVVSKLRERGCEDIFAVRKRDYDLVKGSEVERLYRDSRPDLVVHLAGVDLVEGLRRTIAGIALRSRPQGKVGGGASPAVFDP
jgi:GDP-L-fucose synthase